MQERLSRPHHHVLGHRVLWAKCAEALRLLRLHQLVILALIHGVCMQSAPEAFIYSLNLTGKSLAGISSGIAGSCAGWRSISHLRLDFASRRLGLSLLSAGKARRLRCTSLGTSMAMQVLESESLLDLKLDDLRIAWSARVRLPCFIVSVLCPS